jgi:hypothetical protein
LLMLAIIFVVIPAASLKSSFLISRSISAPEWFIVDVHIVFLLFYPYHRAVAPAGTFLLL